LTAFKGQTIRIEFEAKEDNAALTSFVVDDVVITVRHEPTGAQLAIHRHGSRAARRKRHAGLLIG